jgi:transcriptional regulator with XRE-family HTH domain
VTAVTTGRFTDLDPADAAARRVLIADLRRYREETGLTQADVARHLGLRSVNGAISNIENADNWQLRTLQALARLYGRRLLVDIDATVPTGDGDPLAAMLTAMRPTTATGEDELARAVLVRNLRRIRIHRCYRQADIATRIGTSVKAVQLWEQGTDGVMVAPTQRYGRAIKAPIAFRLVPAVPLRSADSTFHPALQET